MSAPEDNSGILAAADEIRAYEFERGHDSRDDEVADLDRLLSESIDREKAAEEKFAEHMRTEHPDEPEEPEEPEEPQPTDGLPYIVGISRSTGGLNHSEAAKSAETKERYDQFAAAAGVTPEKMRAAGGRHVYYTGSSLPNDITDIGVVKNVADDGYGNCMFTASRFSDRAGRANGDWNERFKTFFRTKHKVKGSALDRMVIVYNEDHEPTNDADKWDPAQWCMVQAQRAKTIWELDDPTVYYSTCHIPSGTTAAWAHLAALKRIAPDHWREIDARTYVGLDPYPEAEKTTPPQLGTVWNRIDKAVGVLRGAGHTGPLAFNEVALFHYDDTGSNKGAVPLTGAQQAKRLHDNFCVELQEKDDLRALWYFDVTDVNNPRGDTRILQTPEEQAEYAAIILGKPGHLGR